MLLTDEADSILVQGTATSWSWTATSIDAADPTTVLGQGIDLSYGGFLFDPPRTGPEWDDGGPGYNFAHVLYKDDLNTWPPGGSRVLLKYTFKFRTGDREQVQQRNHILHMRTR